MTSVEFAALKITGLKSPNTVSAYRQRWQEAMDAIVWAFTADLWFSGTPGPFGFRDALDSIGAISSANLVRLIVVKDSRESLVEPPCLPIGAISSAASPMAQRAGTA